jgi:REP element-mobilizing transposase RayT
MKLPRRKHHHLPEHIYRLPGSYFITICTRERQHHFGTIDAEGLGISQLGQLVEERWRSIPEHHFGVSLDIHVVMPNHFHGLISTSASSKASEAPHIGKIVGAFKSSVTRHGRERGLIGTSIWQDDYWDHVVRSQEDLDRIRVYIENNPLSWHIDRENEERVGLNEFYEWLDKRASIGR